MAGVRQFRTPTLLLGFFVYAPPILGAPPAALNPQAPEPALQASASDELYAKAQSQYAVGDLEGALETMAKGYELGHSPNLLFNLGQLHRELSHCAQAVDYYDRYVVAAPNGERVVDAKRYAVALRAQCPVQAEAEPRAEPSRPIVAAPAPAPAPRPLVTPPRAEILGRTPTHDPWRIAGWVAFGTAVATATSAVYFAVETKQAKDDVQTGMNALDFNWGRDGARLEHRQDDFFRDRALAYGFATVTALALGTGAFAWTLGAPDKPSSAGAWSITVSADLLHTDCRVRF